MCGIVGVVRRRARRTSPDIDRLAHELAEAGRALAASSPVPARLDTAAALVSGVDAALGGAPGVRALVAAPDAARALDDQLASLWHELDAIEQALDRGAPGLLAAAELELVNASLVRARDAVWAVRRDRLGTAHAVAALAPSSPTAVDAYLSIEVALVRARPARGTRPRLGGRARARAWARVGHRGSPVRAPAADSRT